jgi:hypothetical protein
MITIYIAAMGAAKFFSRVAALSRRGWLKSVFKNFV